MTAQDLLASLTIYYVGLSMAFDYSLVLLSIEELWIALQGNVRLFGLVFGIYALSQAIITPVLGYISDLRGIKFTLLLSMVINAIGNIVYSLSFIVSSVHLVIAGRFISGLGAGSIVLGTIYLTNTTSREKRGKSIACFKLAQALGYFGGPALGLAFTTLKQPNVKSSITTKLFNAYTLPSWVACVNVVALVVPAIKLFFKNPIAPHMALRYNHREAKELILHVAFLSPILFMASTCYWLVTSDLFTLAFGQYHLIRSSQDLWKVYVSGGFTLVAACVLIRLTIHKQEKTTPTVFTVLGILMAAFGFGLLGDFKLTNNTISTAFYYGSVGFLTSGGALFFTGSGTYFSRKVTDLSHQARNRRGLYLGCFMLAESFGRFVGPTLSSLVVYVTENKNTLHKCDLINVIPDGCHASHLNVTLITLCCVMLILTVCFVVYHRQYGKCQVDISLLSLEELPMPRSGDEIASREILGSSPGTQSDSRSRSSTDDVSVTSLKSEHMNSMNNNVF